MNHTTIEFNKPNPFARETATLEMWDDNIGYVATGDSSFEIYFDPPGWMGNGVIHAHVYCNFTGGKMLHVTAEWHSDGWFAFDHTGCGRLHYSPMIAVALVVFHCKR